MACGTGKTFTSLKIAEQLATDHKAQATTVLFLVPSIQLLNQTLREWTQESELPFRAFAVCSDAKVGKRQDRPREDIAVHDLIYPATTDTRRSPRRSRRSTSTTDFTVVFSHLPVDRRRGAGPAGRPARLRPHHLRRGPPHDRRHPRRRRRVARSSASTTTATSRAAKRLYMTATPRLFDPKTKEKAQDANAVLASMDDEAVYGPVLHRLGFGEAVEKDLLTDYKVLVLKVDESFVAESFQQRARSTPARSSSRTPPSSSAAGTAWPSASATRDRRRPRGRPHPDEDAPWRSPANIKRRKAATEAFPSIVDRLIATYAEDDDSASDANRHRMQVDDPPRRRHHERAERGRRPRSGSRQAATRRQRVPRAHQRPCLSPRASTSPRSTR